MGNKTSELVQERKISAKTTNFKSRFLVDRRSGIETPATPSGADNSMDMKSFCCMIDPKDEEPDYLTLEVIISILEESKTLGTQTFFAQKSVHKLQRKNFLSKHSNWGKKYEDLCSELREEYNSLILSQNQELQTSLEDAGKLVLNKYNLTEELLARNLLRYSSNTRVTSLLHTLNTFEILNPPSLSISVLYDIIHYKLSRLQILSSLIWTQDGKKKCLILCYLLSDEIESEYQLDEDQLNGALRLATIDPYDPLLPRFRDMKREFEIAWQGIGKL